jgi:chromosome segregation ATPase
LNPRNPWRNPWVPGFLFELHTFFKEIAMNELPTSLTEIIKQREATINDLKARLEHEEGHYVALQNSYNQLLTERNGLQAEVRSLQNSKIRMNEEVNYWRDSYKDLKTRLEIQEEVYLKIIRELSNRD